MLWKRLANTVCHYCMTITLCFLDNSIYHKICVLTCRRIISTPTRLYKKEKTAQFLYCLSWSGWRGSNPLPPPWQGGALPDELHPHFIGASGRNRTTDTGIFSPLLYRLSYRGKNWRPGTGSNRRPLAWQASVLTNWTTGPNVVGTTGLEPVTLCL